MSQSAPDDARLRATELQMRRALGLQDASPSPPKPTPPVVASDGSHAQRRRFMRDGEVPVTMIHRDHRNGETSASNQLDAARQALRAASTAREHAERQLEDVQATLRGLQTQLAHERLARDEALQAVQRVAAEKAMIEQVVQGLHAELATERDARRHAETRCQELAVTVCVAEADSLAASEPEAMVAVQPRPVRKPVAKVAPSGESPTVEPKAAAPKRTVTTRAARLAAKQAAAKAKRLAADRQPKLVKWWVEGWQKEV